MIAVQGPIKRMLFDLHGQATGSAPTHQLDQPSERDGQPQAPRRAGYLCLAWRSASPEAEALCDDLLDQVVCHWQTTGQPDDPVRRPNKSRNAVAGFTGAGVASQAPHARREQFRPWTPNSFSASTTTAVEDVGYRPAKAVRDALCHLGHLEVVEPPPASVSGSYSPVRRKPYGSRTRPRLTALHLHSKRWRPITASPASVTSARRCQSGHSTYAGRNSPAGTARHHAQSRCH